MATANPHRKRIRVRIKVNGRTYTTTINRKPTKSNCKAVERECEEYRPYLAGTGDWATVRAELRGEQGHIASGSLSDYAERWLNTAPVDSTTLAEYQRTYNRVWRPLGDRAIGSILRSEIAERLADIGVAPKTQRNYISILSGIFAIAQGDGVMNGAPTDNWKYPKVMKKAPAVYTPEERDSLLEAITDPVAHRFYSLGFFSGMRLSELLPIQPRQYKRPVIVVDQVRSRYELKQRTKNHRSREAFVPDHIWALLEPTRFQEWAFSWPDKRPFIDGKDLQLHLDQAHKDTGILKVGTRNPWRHTYISIALMEGIRPPLVAQQTGHDLRALYENYAAFIPRDTDHSELASVFGGTESAPKNKKQG